MVMHARKLPRLNDGYFDRNQAHPYQNTSKYASKSSYNDRYNDKVRDSPSNGSAYRNDSPEGQHSPRDRSYHNKSSYSQRTKERDRDRQDRETSRSPKDREKNKNTSRDHHQSSSHRGSDTTSSDHHSNHDRNSTEDKEKDKEKRLQVGDWSEHISSSGKKYYYNCKTEVSQWEKPKEWIEWERQQGKVSSDSNKIKDRAHEKTSTSSTTNKTAASEKHSNERNSRSSSSSSGHHHHHHSRSHDDRHHTKSGSSSSSSSSSRNYVVNEHGSHRSNQSQHKGVENNSRNTERTEHARQTGDNAQRRDGERRVDVRKNSEDSQTQDMDISPDSTPTGSQPNSQPQSCTQTPISSQPTPTQTPVSIASLPRLLSQLAGNKGLPHMEKPELSAQEALQTLQTAILLTRQVSLAQTNMTNQSSHSSVSHMDTSPFLTQKSPLPIPMPSHSAVVSAVPLAHSDGKARAEEDRDRGRTSPGSEYSHHSSRRGSPTSSVSSLQSITTTGTTSLASAALRPAAPLLTPSLANYYREDLISHVTGWQADHAERQSNRYSEEAHTIGSLNSTKVSAELKMSRSLVRVAEIQSTLQEQRILFLRQQIKELEEWKSQNSFMSDS